MINNSVRIEEIIKNNNIYIDVRAPREFVKGKIPGAYNLPIFGDMEHHIVGLTYKENGKQAAEKKGLQLVKPKLEEYLSQISDILNGQEGIVYCWRGGLRSKSVVSYLKSRGLKVYQLQGGYKAYRKMVYDFLKDYSFNQPIFVLYGYTGSGKSALLDELNKMGQPVLDLERLANHRGSIFGDLGLGDQPSQKDFESVMFQELNRLSDSSFLIIEGESTKIGCCHLPPKIAGMLKESNPVLLNASFSARQNRIKRSYLGKISDTEILEKIDLLKQYISMDKIEKLRTTIEHQDYSQAIEILLKDYYDPLYYRSSLKNKNFEFELEIKDNITETANKLIAKIESVISQPSLLINQAG